MFPIHPDDRLLINSIPWDLIKSHQKQAMKNHSQTLERLQERGGLSIVELYYVLRDEPLKLPFVNKDDALKYLQTRLELFKETQNATKS